MKSETMTIDEARELVANPLLWPLVRDFLWDFAPSVHASWKDGLKVPDGMDAFPRVKRHILDSLGVEPCFHAFPKEDGSRILLLDGATLESIAKWLGALACADALRRVTSGADVRRLKAELPGIYPEVFGYTMYFGEFVSRRDAEAQSLQAMVVEEGLALLLSALSNVPPSPVSRLKFKLPKMEWPEGRETLDMERERLAAALKKLLKLRFPEAYKLCCS